MHFFNPPSLTLPRTGFLVRLGQNHILKGRRRPASLGMISVVPHMVDEIAMPPTSGDQQ